MDGVAGKIRSLLGLRGVDRALLVPLGDPAVETMDEAEIDRQLRCLLAEQDPAVIESVKSLWEVLPDQPARTAAITAPVAQASSRDPGAGNWTEARILALIEEGLARRLKLVLRPGDRKKPFTDFGLDSINAVKLGTDLQSQLGRDVNPALFWEHATIEALARKLASDQGKVTRP